MLSSAFKMLQNSLSLLINSLRLLINSAQVAYHAMARVFSFGEDDKHHKSQIERLNNKDKGAYFNIKSSSFSLKVKNMIIDLEKKYTGIDLNGIFQAIRYSNGEHVSNEKNNNLSIKRPKEEGNKMIEKLKELIAILQERQKKVINLHL